MSEPKRGYWEGHSHAWVFGILGLAAGLILLVYVPSLKAISESLLLLAGFHIVGGIVLAVTLWYGMLRDRLRRPLDGEPAATTFDFGWDPAWTNGLLVAALIAVSAAVAIQAATLTGWPFAFAALLVSFSFFTGYLLMRSYRRVDHALLPMVDLLSDDQDLVLDAGCGAGRTTIALGRAAMKARIVAFDRFDAGYIEGGGKALLARNLRLAKLSDRVRIEAGDLTQMPFDDQAFDSVVSTHVYDHLGNRKEDALRETFRVLKPGGRFLLGLSVPGWAMFAVANVLSFLLTSKHAWRDMARRAGFEVRDEGVFNGVWFVLLSKPDPSHAETKRAGAA